MYECRVVEIVFEFLNLVFVVLGVLYLLIDAKVLYKDLEQLHVHLFDVAHSTHVDVNDSCVEHC